MRCVILTPHFKQLTSAKIFWCLFPFVCQYHQRTMFVFFLFVQHWSCHSEFFHYSICSFIYGTVDIGYFYMTFSDFSPWHTLAKVFSNKYCCSIQYISCSLTYTYMHMCVCLPSVTHNVRLSTCPTLQHQQRKFMWAGSHKQVNITLSCSWRHN